MSRRMVARTCAAERLGIPADAPVVAVLIVGRADDVPIGTGWNFFVSDGVPGFQSRIEAIAAAGPATFSFFEALASLGLTDLQRKTMRLRARRPGGGNASS